MIPGPYGSPFASVSREARSFPLRSACGRNRGTGRICVVCNTDISAHDLENEMILGPVTIWAHMQCYMIWREESCLTNGDRPFRAPRLSTYEEA